jgi:transcriptional regulator with XRE-family HTH domain
MVEKQGKKASPHTPEEKKALGQCLKEAREAAGFSTQVEAAEELRVVKQTINSWESGTNIPDALWLRRIARAYETTVSRLVGDEVASWPFLRTPVGRVLALEPDDLSYVEGRLAAALSDVSPDPSPEDLARFNRERASQQRTSRRRKSA